MNLGLNGKVALVTAASRGLGKAVALELSHEGAKVAICARREDKVLAAAEDISARTNGEVAGFAADVTDGHQVKELVDAVRERFGPIEILVPNAGGPPGGTISEFKADDYRAAVELNLMSTINLCYAVLPHMRENRWGRIVAITSVSSRQPLDHLVLSNTARAGVLGFIKSLSNHVAAEGITVNAVCPGYTKTERIKELAKMYADSGKGTLDDYYRKVEVDVPMKRMGTVEEFAAVVTFLVSERASYVTGVALPIDGGWIKSLY